MRLMRSKLFVPPATRALSKRPALAGQTRFAFLHERGMGTARMAVIGAGEACALSPVGSARPWRAETVRWNHCLGRALRKAGRMAGQLSRPGAQRREARVSANRSDTATTLPTRPRDGRRLG